MKTSKVLNMQTFDYQAKTTIFFTEITHLVFIQFGKNVCFIYHFLCDIIVYSLSPYCEQFVHVLMIYFGLNARKYGNIFTEENFSIHFWILNVPEIRKPAKNIPGGLCVLHNKHPQTQNVWTRTRKTVTFRTVLSKFTR